MLIILTIVALAAGVVAAVLLWPYGAFVAIVAAPVAASAAVLLTALGFLACAPKEERARGRNSNMLLHALSRLLPR